MTAEDVVFDGDHFNTNAVGHPLGGTAYYQIARGNGLGPGASFIASVLGSTFWEYFVEIPEHPSLNDMILTPAGGAVIGETTYQLGRYLARSGSSLGHCAGAFVFSPVASINDRPICRVSPGGLLPWAKLGLSIGVNRAVFDGSVVREELAVAMGSEIVTQRAYQRPGSGSVHVAPGQWSSLFADGRFGGNHLDGFWFHGQTVWGGRYDRNYQRGRRRDRRAARRAASPGLGDDARAWAARSTIGCAICRGCTTGSRRSGWADRCSSSPRAAACWCASRCPPSTRSRSSGRWRIARNTRWCSARPSRRRCATAGTTTRTAWSYAATLHVDLGPIGFTGDARGGWYWSIDVADPAQSTIRQ